MYRMGSKVAYNVLVLCISSYYSEVISFPPTFKTFAFRLTYFVFAIPSILTIAAFEL